MQQDKPKRPRLDDPKEWALIRKMYFGGMEKPWSEDIDPLERLDRMEHKQQVNHAR